MDKKKISLSAILGSVMVMASGMSAFAAEGGQSEAVTGALQTVATDVIATITAIAPVALSIVGIFIVWKLGMKFFKTISSKG